MNIPTWKKIDRYETIMISKKDRPVVKFVIMFPFGASLDPKGKEGLTNLTGDMLLRGCADYAREELENKLDELGASLNVYTGFHTLSIEGSILKRHFPELIRIVQSVLTAPSFDEDELDKIKNELISQMRLRLDDDQGLAKTAFNRALYHDHLYAQEIEGSASTLPNITAQDLKEHYKKTFSKDGIHIGLSGDVSNAMIDLCIFTLERSLTTEGVSTMDIKNASSIQGRNLTFVDKPERTQTHFFVGHPTQPITAKNNMDFVVFKTAFSGGLFQAKYMQEIRVKRGWSYGAYGATDHRKWASHYYLYTFPKNQDTADALQTTLELYEKASQGDLLTQEDIEFAKNYLYKSFPFKIDTPDKVLSQKIHQKLLGLPDDYIQTYRERLQAVDPKDIHTRIQDHFDPQNVVISVLGTQSEVLQDIQDKIKPKETQTVPFTSLI